MDANGTDLINREIKFIQVPHGSGTCQINPPHVGGWNDPLVGLRLLRSRSCAGGVHASRTKIIMIIVEGRG